MHYYIPIPRFFLQINILPPPPTALKRGKARLASIQANSSVFSPVAPFLFSKVMMCT